MGIMAGDTVAIQGLGGLGHLGLQYVRKMGYRTVALSSSDYKRDFAMKLGANEYIDGSKEDQGEALQKLGGAALIVCTAPNPEVITGLMNGLAPMGKLLILARKSPAKAIYHKSSQNISCWRRSRKFHRNDHERSLCAWVAFGPCTGLRRSDTVCAASRSQLHDREVPTQRR